MHQEHERYLLWSRALSCHLWWIRYQKPLLYLHLLRRCQRGPVIRTWIKQFHSTACHCHCKDQALLIICNCGSYHIGVKFSDCRVCFKVWTWIANANQNTSQYFWTLIDKIWLHIYLQPQSTIFTNGILHLTFRLINSRLVTLITLLLQHCKKGRKAVSSKTPKGKETSLQYWIDRFLYLSVKHWRISSADAVWQIF